MGQTVNLLSFDFGGSNPSSPTKKQSGMTAFLFIYPIFVLNYKLNDNGKSQNIEEDH